MAPACRGSSSRRRVAAGSAARPRGWASSAGHLPALPAVLLAAAAASLLLCLPAHAQRQGQAQPEVGTWSGSGSSHGGDLAGERPQRGLQGDESDLYIVLLKGDYPAAGVYEGGIPGYPATAPGFATSQTATRRTRAGVAGDRPRFNRNAPHVRQYLSLLRHLHHEVVRAARLRHRHVIYSYTTVLNAFAVRLLPSELPRVRRHPLVARVERNAVARPLLTRSPQFLNISAALWAQAKGANHSGQNVVVGVIDSGIWPENPFFNDSAFPTSGVPFNWFGSCNTTADFPASACSKKLIGAQFYADVANQVGLDLSGDFLSPRDTYGHGTWCASAAAGSQLAQLPLNGRQLGAASGMAPRAFLSVYKVFWTTLGVNGEGASFGAQVGDILAGIDAAASDHVDVLSCSFGLPNETEYFSNSLEWAYLSATKMGIVVVAAGGNAGSASATNYYPTLSNVAPYIFTVGASTIDRTCSATVTLGSGSSFSVPSLPSMSSLSGGSLVGASACGIAGATVTQVRRCYPGALDATKCLGKILVCDQDPTDADATPDLQRIAVEDMGGAGLVIANEAGFTAQVACSQDFPCANVLPADGDAIRAYILANAKPTISFGTPSTSFSGEAPLVASFSSTGPIVDPSSSASIFTNDILKPDIIAPGVNLVAAFPGSLGSSTPTYGYLSGSSMATPHVAGVVAIIRQKHPFWSPAQIKSAVMTSASVTTNKGNPITTDSGGAVTPWDMGSGHINVGGVLDPGLTFDIKYGDYVNFLYGRQPSVTKQTFFRLQYKALTTYDLNYPNIVVSLLSNSAVTVTRRVKNVGRQFSTYTASVAAPSNARVTVSPSKLIVAPGMSKTFTVTFSVTSRSRAFAFGSLTWSDEHGHKVRSVLGLQAI